MENRAHALVALIFLAVLGAALVIAGLWMHHAQPQGVEYNVVSPFSVTGLTVQAAVRFKGVQVGEVKSIGFDPSNPRMVQIRVSIRKGAPITRATYAELAPQGVTGLSYISLSDFGKDFSPVTHKPGQLPEIPMRPSFLQVLSRQGESLVNEGNTLATRMNDLLDAQNRRHFGATLAHLDQATAELAALEKSLHPALKELPATIAATRSTMVASRELVEHLNTLAVSAQAPLQHMTATTASLEHLTAAGNEAIATLNYQTLPQVAQLSQNLLSSSRALSRLSTSLEHDPQSLLYGRKSPPPGPGQAGYGGAH